MKRMAIGLWVSGSLAGSLLLATPGFGQGPSSLPLEVEVHATGIAGELRRDVLTPFEESRLLAGGRALAGFSPNWSLGLNVEVGWVDQDGTTYMYDARLRRRLFSIGVIDFSGMLGIGGVTTRLEVPGVKETETDLLVPLAASLANRKRDASFWGFDLTLTDWIVREQLLCDCVSIGGPTPETGESTSTHNLGLSAGIWFQTKTR